MSQAAADYVLGHSVHETERLMLQARLLRPYTERFFRAAGLSPGMRVLDIGSGMGDVSLLAADIVGPAGRVLGLDRDAAAVAAAGQRAVAQGCSSWVSFQTSDLDGFQAADLFEALVGRYILLFLPDPVATIRNLLRDVRPGGIVAFHDIDFPDPRPSHPPCPLYDQTYALVGEALRRAGSPPDFGRRLGNTFVNAGLPFPTVAGETIAGGGPGSYVYWWVASTLISVAPQLEKLGLTLPPEIVADHTLAGRLEQEAAQLGAQLLAPSQFGAWTRKP